MLASRVRVLHEYVELVRAGQLPYDHALLRDISSLTRRLPAMNSDQFQQARARVGRQGCGPCARAAYAVEAPVAAQDCAWLVVRAPWPSAGLSDGLQRHAAGDVPRLHHQGHQRRERTGGEVQRGLGPAEVAAARLPLRVGALSGAAPPFGGAAPFRSGRPPSRCAAGSSYLAGGRGVLNRPRVALPLGTVLRATWRRAGLLGGCAIVAPVVQQQQELLRLVLHDLEILPLAVQLPAQHLHLTPQVVHGHEQEPGRKGDRPRDVEARREECS
eukprot:scaffold351_cov371-Prasinococcus_capsulatus_cf.AAC.5